VTTYAEIRNNAPLWPGVMDRSLLEVLKPPPATLDCDRIAALNSQLTAVIDDLIQHLFRGGDLRRMLRYPPVEVLHELPRKQLWFPVPYLWGGFRIGLRDNDIEVVGGYRELDPVGDVPVATVGYTITPENPWQVYEGYE